MLFISLSLTFLISTQYLPFSDASFIQLVTQPGWTRGEQPVRPICKKNLLAVHLPASSVNSLSHHRSPNDFSLCNVFLDLHGTSQEPVPFSLLTNLLSQGITQCSHSGLVCHLSMNPACLTCSPWRVHSQCHWAPRRWRRRWGWRWQVLQAHPSGKWEQTSQWQDGLLLMQWQGKSTHYQTVVYRHGPQYGVLKYQVQDCNCIPVVYGHRLDNVSKSMVCNNKHRVWKYSPSVQHAWVSNARLRVQVVNHTLYEVNWVRDWHIS